MLCLGRLGGISYSINSFHLYDSRYTAKRFLHLNNRFNSRWRLMALESESSFAPSVDSEAMDKNASGYFLPFFFFLDKTSVFFLFLFLFYLFHWVVVFVFVNLPVGFKFRYPTYNWWKLAKIENTLIAIFFNYIFGSLLI